jgi:hypothetical protein
MKVSHSPTTRHPGESRDLLNRISRAALPASTNLVDPGFRLGDGERVTVFTDSEY